MVVEEGLETIERDDPVAHWAHRLDGESSRLRFKNFAFTNPLAGFDRAKDFFFTILLAPRLQRP